MTGACILLNGEALPLEAATLAGMLHAQGIASAAKGVAVAVNGAVVPRRAWQATILRPGDRVEVVKMVSGG